MMLPTYRLKACEVSVKKTSGELEPLREALAAMTAMKESGMEECAELKVSLEQWRARVETLTKQYKLVDPEDHARVKVCTDNYVYISYYIPRVYMLYPTQMYPTCA